MELSPTGKQQLQIAKAEVTSQPRLARARAKLCVRETERGRASVRVSEGAQDVVAGQQLPKCD